MTGGQHSNELTIYVTHVEAEDQYLKVWGQIDKNAATQVERIILPLIPLFERGVGCPGLQSANLVQNAMGCAKYQNDGYYRAKICSIRPDGMVVVQYVDYGNFDILSPQEIHLLDDIPGTEMLRTFNAVAYCFTLANVLPINGLWENKTVDTIKKTLWYNEYKAVLISRQDNRYFIKINYNNEDFSEMLVRKQLAVGASIEDMCRPKTIQQPQVPMYQQYPLRRELTNPFLNSATIQNVNINPMHRPVHNIQSGWQNVPHTYPVPQKQPLPPIVQEALVFKSRVLEIGSSHNVCVSWVEDGPLKFSIQLEVLSDMLMKLMREINSQSTQPLQEPPLPGAVCLGRYTEKKLLCRAVVMSVMDDKCKLYYVDYGWTEVLPYKDIYQLPPQYINPKVLSIRLTLSGLRDLNVREDMKAFFKEYALNRRLVLHVRPPEGPPLIQYGDLYDNGKNVKDILIEKFPTSVKYQNPNRLTKGSEEIVHVSFVESCRNFFIQLDSMVHSLESIMTTLAECASSSPLINPANIFPGMPCAALYDGQWYRAKVLNVSGESVRVLYVDYGNEETVNTSSLHSMHPDLVRKLPAQAIKCIWNGSEGLPCTQEYTSQFEALVLEKRLYMKVIDILGDGLLVDLQDPEKVETIISQLIHAMTAAKSNRMTSNQQNQEPKNYTQMPSQPNVQRYNAQPYPSLTEWQKIKIKAICDHSNKWNQKKQTDHRRQSPYDESTSSGRNKSKTWKEGINEEKQHSSRYDKSNDSSFTEATKSKSNKFSRGDSYNKPNRDDFNSSFNKRDKDSSTGKGRFSNNDSRQNRSTGSDKTWSDKDSDASSKGSGKRGRDGSGRGGGRGNRRDNFNGRNQWGESDNNSGRDSSSGKGQWNVRDSRERTRKDDQGRESFAGKGHWNSRDHSKGSYRSNKDNVGDQHSGNYKHRERKYESDGVYKKPSSIGSWDSSNAGNHTANNLSQNERFGRKSITISPQKIPLTSIKECEVVYTKNPSEFFIQISPDYLELDTLMEKIASSYENNKTLLDNSKVYKGMHCIAQYAVDLKWYRAMIESVSGNNVSVAFIDYGNVESVDIDKVRSLEDEFSKLPIQAIHCKLFGSTKTEWNQNEIEDFKKNAEGITLQAEFVSEKNGVYEVLIRSVINGTASSNYINEQFCSGVDLVKAKENLSRQEHVTKVPEEKTQVIPADYVSADFEWSVVAYEPGSKESAFVSWYVDPSDFYCQLQNRESEFRNMMIEIQKVYKSREPFSGNLQVGTPVVAIFSEDQALYRAEIVEVTDAPKYIVQYIDFGNRAIVDQSKIYPVDRKFTHLPKQSARCCLKDVYPKEATSWAKNIAQDAYTYFNADKYECTFHDFTNDKYVISMRDGNCDIAETLVNKGLATDTISKAENNKTDFVMSIEVEQVDINLLYGQTLKVQISSVENTEKFYIRLPAAKKSEQMIDKYMANKDPKVMRRLSRRELCPGAGCLIFSSGTWRRAVTTDCSKDKGFQVRYIDTGAYDEIHLDNVLALPEQLAAIQNQAIECCVKNVPSSPEVNTILKELLNATEVILFVDDVDCNRLVVTLYDSSGTRIKFSETDKGKIPPICPMPILSSTHKVTVSYAENSANVWLQRNVDYELDLNLQEALREHYNHPRKMIKPTVGELCAAKSSDGEWYRAHVVNIVENGAYVNFIDYGNTELISSDALMELDQQFHTPYQLAVRVSLSVCLKGTDSEQVTALQSQLLNKELTAVFYNVHNKWIVELSDNEEKLSDKFRSLGLVADPNEVCEEEELHDAEMIVDKKYKVFVSHVDSPSQFWLQRVEEAAILEEKHKELQSAVKSFQVVEGILEEGSLCAAVYSIDNDWYRAEVLDADEDITTVRFIDYGNTDVIDNKSGNIRQLPEDWLTPKRFATKCRLHVIPVDSEDWSEAACEKFENLVISTENVRVSLIADIVPKRVDLFVEDKSVSQILVEENHASLVHTEGELIDELVDLELDPHSAFVSHINSPSEFWVQEEKSVADLEVMTDRFIVADLFPKVNDIQEGMLCVAKYPEDGLWYRARIISHSDSGTQVIYIDYGNSATSTEIREIPRDLANTAPLSRKCCLALPEGVKEWSREACTEFLKLAADGETIFLLDVIKDHETSLVKLTLNGQDVAELLAAHCERQSPTIEERLPPLGEENSPNVFISHINGPDEFWIQAESKVGELELMSERLQDAQSFVQLEAMKVGNICAAKFPDDGLWYRAKIISLEGSEPHVLYIDYGNSANTSELRVLPEDIVNIPFLSKKCTLVLSEELQSWTQDACAKFKELAAEGVTSFQFEILNDAEVAQISLSFNGKDVMEFLAPLCEKKLVKTDEKGVNEEQSNVIPSKGFVDESCKVNDTDRESMERNASTNSETCEIIYDSRTAQNENEKSATAYNDKTNTMLDEIITLSTTESMTKSDSLVDSMRDLEIEPTLESTRVSANEPVKGSSSANVNETKELENNLSKCEAEESQQDNMEESFTHAIGSSDAEEVAAKIKSKVTDEVCPDEEKGTETQLANNAVTELSVDEIVQSMMKNTMEDGHVNTYTDVNAQGSETSIAAVSSTEAPNEVSNAVHSIPITENVLTSQDNIAVSREIIGSEIDETKKLEDLSLSEETSVLTNSDKVNAERLEDNQAGTVDVKPLESSSTESASQANSFAQSAMPETPVTPKIHREDKIVPGSISRGESPNPILERPPTPKTPHSEKLVAGAVNPHELIPEDVDETIAVFVQAENIPADKKQ